MQFAQRLLSTRGGTIAVAGLAAILAAVIFLFYLNRYRDSINESAQPLTVLVASSSIPKGTPGDAVGSQALFQTTSAPKSEVKEGAFTDPAALTGRVAVADIYPGQQLTATDFTATPTDAIANKLAGDERAISVPLDEAHGMIGEVHAGDKVDLLAGFNVTRDNGPAVPVLKTIIQNIPVLAVPEDTKGGFGGGGGNNTASVTLQMNAEQAAELAFSSDNGKVWIVLRPPAGAPEQKLDLVTLESLLFGVKPIRVLKGAGQ